MAFSRGVGCRPARDTPSVPTSTTSRRRPSTATPRPQLVHRGRGARRADQPQVSDTRLVCSVSLSPGALVLRVVRLTSGSLGMKFLTALVLAVCLQSAGIILQCFVPVCSTGCLSSLTDTVCSVLSLLTDTVCSVLSSLTDTVCNRYSPECNSFL